LEIYQCLHKGPKYVIVYNDRQRLGLSACADIP